MGATLQWRQTNRVPFEFLGKARILRNAVHRADQDCDAAISQVLGPLRARLERKLRVRHKPTLRPEHIADATRAWAQSMPSAFRIAPNKPEHKKNRQLVLSEFRLVTIKSRHEKWDDPDWEPGVAIAKVELRVENGTTRLACDPLVALSLHALARRFERGFDRSQEAVVRDVLEIVLGEWLDDRIITRAGIWRGGYAQFMDGETVSKTRSIRTFVVFE